MLLWQHSWYNCTYTIIYTATGNYAREVKSKKTTTMTTIKRQFLVPRASLQLKTTPTKKLPEISLSSIKELHIFWGFLLKVFFTAWWNIPIDSRLPIERTYICETSSFGRKVSRRKAVLLLGFSCSVAFYNKTMGFFNRLILYQINYEGFRYLVNDFKGLPTFFQWFMALSSWKNGFVFVLHTLQGIKFR